MQARDAPPRIPGGRALSGAVLLLLLLPAAALPFSGGPPERTTWCGESGSLPVCSGGTCNNCTTACHDTFGGPNTGSGGVSIENLPSAYEPGTEYLLAVLLEDTANPDFSIAGFQLSTLRASDLCQAGELTSAAPGTAVDLDAATATQWLEHRSPQGASGGTTMWEFLWRAPDPAAGEVVFDVCANAANGAQGNSGDRIYCTSATVAPVQSCEPFSLTTTASTGPGDCEALVAWNASGNDGATSFDVELSTDGGMSWNAVPGCSGLTGVGECLHAGAPWGEDLLYRVRGTDSCPEGARQALDTADTTVRVADANPPSFDAPLLDAGVDRCTVTVTWDTSAATDDCSGVAGYRVFREEGAFSCGGTTVAEIVDPGTGSFTETVASPAELHYRVLPFDAAGNVTESCEAATTSPVDCTPLEEPVFPAGLLRREPGTDELRLSWTEVGATGYHLYRGPLGDVGTLVLASGAYEALVCGVSGTEAVDDTAGFADGDDDDDFFYLVVPVDAAGEEGTYGCTREGTDGGCDQPRLPAASPCP